MDNDKYEWGLQRFNRTNLVNEVSKVVHVSKRILMQEFKDYIWPRLDFLTKRKNNRNSRYFVFERDYVETEWKDMVSVHYINTSYKVQNTVMRVHIFGNREVSSETYLGFFTLRKVDEARIMLSYIYPNWRNIVYRDKVPYVMTYQKKVHLQGIELQIDTYPLFVQDNLTVACAQANIVSMTKYLHHKFDNQMMRIKNMNTAYATKKMKSFPTIGLNPQQMLEVFNASSISVQYITIDGNDQRLASLCRGYVDYSVESGIPVLIGGVIKNSQGKLNQHVVQIIGHTKQDREKYVIYDDSGYLIRNMRNDRDGFVTVAGWEELCDIFRGNKWFLIYPIHEKVYLFYDDIKQLFLMRYDSVKELRELCEEGLAVVEETRYMLVDNRIIKAFLRQKLDDDITLESERTEITRLLKLNMSHYVWYCEVPLVEGYLIFIADPTYSKLTTKDIFYSDAIYSEQQLSLLKYKMYM